VCGRLPNTFGCYGGGNLTSFESGCAVLEGAPHTKGNVVTRGIYVLDRRVSDSDPVTLFVYTRTDTITDSFDTVFVGLERQVPLGITGGKHAKCRMAGNHSFVYAGTDLIEFAVSVNKSDFTVTQVGGANTTSITADQRGYVAVNSPPATEPTTRMEKAFPSEGA
jgi:hypothetical protein